MATPPAAATTSTIASTVFDDFNSEGVMNMTPEQGVAVDVAAAGIVANFAGMTSARVGFTTYFLLRLWFVHRQDFGRVGHSCPH